MITEKNDDCSLNFCVTCVRAYNLPTSYNNHNKCIVSVLWCQTLLHLHDLLELHCVTICISVVSSFPLGKTHISGESVWQRLRLGHFKVLHKIWHMNQLDLVHKGAVFYHYPMQSLVKCLKVLCRNTCKNSFATKYAQTKAEIREFGYYESLLSI